MKKSTFLGLLIASFVSNTVSAESTQWHKIGRIKAQGNGATVIWHAAPETLWTTASSACQGTAIYLSPANFPISTATGEREGYQNIMAQVLLSAGTQREVRFTGVTCTSLTAALRPGNIETR